MIKKFFIAIAVFLATALTTLSLPLESTSAAGFSGNCRSFAGLTSWDCGVNISDQNSLKTSIWTIAANIFIDITVIAAYLIIGYVIYGGYLYIFSDGDPGKVMGAKKTLTQAFIGLAIVMLANIIMNTLRAALGADPNADCARTECITPGTMITNAIQWVIGVAGVVAAIFIVIGGISYMTSAGDPGKLQKAKQTITYALIGLAIVALAEIITAFVTNMISSAESGYINQSTIAKEVITHEITKTI
ncbi:hypothetical protein IJG28_02830 [Candidatus Saccharibacteria bacterium]|nr:hypothetical protein [Candidatus Saccharibacteria bacterium]